MPRHAPLLVALVALSLLPRAASAQRWSVEVGWAFLDHDPPSNVTDTGEEVPPGIGIVGRYRTAGGHLFFQAEVSQGVDTRAGAVCGGFVVPGACIPEQVKYSGGVLGLSAGWRLGVALGKAWEIGLLPKAGAAMLRARQRGTDTGRTHSEARLAGRAGASLELSHELVPNGLRVLVSGGADLFVPRTSDCEDCWSVFDRRLPRYTVGLGVRW